jgi:hypothetical protein
MSRGQNGRAARRRPALLAAAAVVIAGLLLVLSLLISSPGQPRGTWPGECWIEIGVSLPHDHWVPWPEGAVHELNGRSE